MKQPFILLLFSIQICQAQRTGTFRFDSLSVTERLKQDVSVLASEGMGGREPGTLFEERAGNYILKRLHQSRIEVRKIPFLVEVDSVSMIESANLLAWIDNHADSTIVYSAHYDHLGMGTDKSREILKKGMHPGADDNSSGVALILEMARKLAAEKKPSYNYVFLALSCHEMGLYGAEDAATSSLFQTFKVKYLVNLDMVGRLDPLSSTIRLSYCSQFPHLKVMEGNANQWNLKVRVDDENTTNNDFSVFCKYGIPSISITTGIHDDYHRIGDTEDKINYSGMWNVLGFILSYQ